MDAHALKELRESDFRQIPDSPGVYWYEICKPIEKGRFKKINPAGPLGNGGDPTVGIEVLEEYWVSNAMILYIG